MPRIDIPAFTIGASVSRLAASEMSDDPVDPDALASRPLQLKNKAIVRWAKIAGREAGIRRFRLLEGAASLRTCRGQAECSDNIR
jgi:hypothetical protein